MALTVGVYVWPGHAHAVAAVTVAALTALNYVGIQRSAWLARSIVAVVITILVIVVVTSTMSPKSLEWPAGAGPEVAVTGVLQAAGLLFFAFAGYARIATLGEEVRDPSRTIPRAIPLALAVTLILYAATAAALLWILGPSAMGSSENVPAHPIIDRHHGRIHFWLIDIRLSLDHAVDCAYPHPDVPTRGSSLHVM